ncbi:MAG: TerB N-terminal domain-containing protein, partial [Acidobacteria bacterium]|nr:TerB N-terminal domain-containing protein [Acidobacteriota bacterium]
CRAAYLEWLAAGRRDPSAYIGYVFLFFYGLERRALADTRRSPQAKQDIPAIIREVEELLQVYGGNSSFRGYASQFLDVLKLVQAEGGGVEPPMERPSYELPISVRVGVGRFVAAGKPLPADWALSWFLTHPETYLRTPAKRCAREFRELFRTRYSRAFGDGLVLKPNRSKLKLAIRPASASFGGEVTVNTDLPDIAALTAPLAKLREIGDSCEADLDAFSRWVGRNPEAPKTVAAAALLPSELAKTHESQEARGLWDWIDKTLGPHDRALCETDDLLQHCASFGSGKLAKSEAVLLAQLLEKGTYGIEPDVRFGGAPLAPGGKAMIFKLPADAAPIASPQYTAATVLLHLAVAISAADGSISAAEEKHFEEHMQRSLALSSAERIRLSAHLSWLMQSRPSLTLVRKRLEALDLQQRRSMAEFVIGVAGADGQISPEEIRTLGKIYPLLGFAADDIYGHVHAMATGTAAGVEGGEPVPITMAQPSAGYAIPADPGTAEAVHLDLAAVKRKFAESAKISAILDDIFTDDEAGSIAQPVALLSPTGRVPAAHGTLLSRLVERPEWNRLDFERIAAECKLLPDGAIDTLNEVAFEVTGVPVIEGDDPIQIDSATAKELLT